LQEQVDIVLKAKLPRREGAISRNCMGSERRHAHAKESDANRLSEAPQAGVVGRYPGWASQREFTLDGKTIKTIERALREVK
jgi:hypothetical protein